MDDIVIACSSCRKTFYVMPIQDNLDTQPAYCCFCGSNKIVDVSDLDPLERPVFTVLKGGKAKPPEERPGVSVDTNEGE